MEVEALPCWGVPELMAGSRVLSCDGAEAVRKLQGSRIEASMFGQFAVELQTDAAADGSLC